MTPKARASEASTRPAGMGLAQVRDDFTGGHVQRGEQVDGAVALIVVGGPLGCGWQHRQGRGGPVQCLDLRFFVDTEHCSCDRWRHVETNDVSDFVNEQRVRRYFEFVLLPRFETERPPDLCDALMVETVLVREFAC